VDLAVTLASLLGINAPTHAIGRVLTEALAPVHRADSSARPNVKGHPAKPSERIQPVALVAQENAQ
jgi:hypothetical protein